MGAGTKVVNFGSRVGVCEECAVLERCLARNVDDPEARRNDDIAVSPRVVRKGDHVYRSGEEFESICLVRSGALKTYMILPNGDEQVVGFHLPGDLVGLDAIDGGTHVCSTQALDTSSVCLLPFKKVTRLGARSKTVQKRLLEGMSRKIRHDENMLLMLGQKSAEQRIAAFLLNQSRRQHARGFSRTEINLPMPRLDIGSYLALAVETVSRVLTRLDGVGVLRVKRNRITILDLPGLEDLADEPRAGTAPAQASRDEARRAV